MDKIAANNHFVTLKKEIKKAKAMVSGKLIRKIKELKKEIEGAEDETKVCKLQAKIDSIHEQIKLMKTLDSYPIAKQATLKPDKEHWDKLASHSKATPEERLTGLIICKNNIQKQVSKFRGDHKDCDEWLEQYIEYREKKNELVKPSRRNPRSAKPTLRSKPTDATRGRKHVGKSREAVNTSDHEDKSRRVVESSNQEDSEDKETLHPSWESKRKQKELMKAALSGKKEQSKRIVFK